MRNARVTVVDAFTPRPFAGNPAAVCVLERAAAEAWMQDLAREMNLAETAFLVPEDGDWRLRWFTPLVEVDLCGHATLASAHVLWEEGHIAADLPARFLTRSGLLTATRRDGWINLDF
ncbi:MAG: PhzF family phenazine biosynthesis protein, partial [Gemmatimonadota bacterium]